jgi:hypothetical protein
MSHTQFSLSSSLFSVFVFVLGAFFAGAFSPEETAVALVGLFLTLVLTGSSAGFSAGLTAGLIADSTDPSG